MLTFQGRVSVFLSILPSASLVDLAQGRGATPNIAPVRLMTTGIEGVVAFGTAERPRTPQHSGRLQRALSTPRPYAQWPRPGGSGPAPPCPCSTLACSAAP